MYLEIYLPYRFFIPLPPIEVIVLPFVSFSVDPVSSPSLFCFVLFFNVYLFLRQSMNGGGAEREGDTELEAGSTL